MADKRYKHIDDVVDEYIQLSDELIEIPLLIQKSQEKYNRLLGEQSSEVYKPNDTDDMFKIFMQIKKHEERSAEIRAEFTEIESLLKEFLAFLNGGKLSIERKDDNDKSKMTYIFWLEGDQIKSNR